MTADELYRQNINDLLTVIRIQTEVIGKQPVKEEDVKRIYYCVKVLKNVTETQKTINALY